jgi:hypothetical protein
VWFRRCPYNSDCVPLLGDYRLITGSEDHSMVLDLDNLRLGIRADRTPVRSMSPTSGIRFRMPGVHGSQEWQQTYEPNS